MRVAIELLLGTVFLVAGAEFLVRGASRLARTVGLSPLVIGLTVVAFGTSAPEMAISVKAALAGEADIAFGNVVGSNIFNVLFILGLSALLAPLAVCRQVVRMDVPVMITVSGLVWLLALDGRVDRLEGTGLFAAFLLYTAFLVIKGRRESAAEAQATGRAAGGDAASPVQGRKVLALSSATALAGLAILVLGARWLVAGAVSLAQMLGVSELVIGLTVVAAGTSLPELVTSVVAALRNERDIAVGNVVGSNVFNILAVLGGAAAASPRGVGAAPAALSFDVPVMTAAAAACLPVFFTGGRIARREGALFLGFYVAYVCYLVMAAQRSIGLEWFGRAMWWFVIPLATLGVLLSVVAALRGPRRTAGARQCDQG